MCDSTTTILLLTNKSAVGIGIGIGIGIGVGVGIGIGIGTGIGIGIGIVRRGFGCLLDAEVWLQLESCVETRPVVFRLLSSRASKRNEQNSSQ